MSNIFKKQKRKTNKDRIAETVKMMNALSKMYGNPDPFKTGKK